VVERRVWGMEELAWRERGDGGVARNELLVGPVIVQLGRPGETSHSKWKPEDAIRPLYANNRNGLSVLRVGPLRSTHAIEAWLLKR